MGLAGGGNLLLAASVHTLLLDLAFLLQALLFQPLLFGIAAAGLLLCHALLFGPLDFASALRGCSLIGALLFNSLGSGILLHCLALRG